MRRICMRKIREAFRLKFEFKHSNAAIARALSIGETTVEEYLARAKRRNISWPLPEDMDNAQLELTLYPAKDNSKEGYLKPEFEFIDKELKRKGVTLRLLWEEYFDRASCSSYYGYGYSTFCSLYKEWKACSDVWMMQSHKGGENTFIDYAGLEFPIFDPATGKEAFSANIFVSALGASNYIFCLATKSQCKEDWIEAHIKMSQFYEGVTECWVPDNLKSGVTKADRYEPVVNQTYLECAHHYGVAVVPARSRKPKDKSLVEGAVYMVETHILAALRDRKFFSLEELNTAMQELLVLANHKPFQKTPGSSRYSLYLECEKPHLKPLPDTRYELFCWGKKSVGANYHILVEHSQYSVPYTLVKKTVEFRYNERTVEVFYMGKAVAIHAKAHEQDSIVTNPHHRPEKHQEQAQILPETIKKTAEQVGAPTLQWVEGVLADLSLHPKQRINIALCVVRLTKKYPIERLNAACARGVRYGIYRARGIKDILAKGLDKKPLPLVNTVILPQQHSNIRGSVYYT